MPDQTIYTLDSAAMNERLTLRGDFPSNTVTIEASPEWDTANSGFLVLVRSIDTHVCAYLPCNLLTPNPEPCYRITESTPVEKREWIVQGIPPEARHLADELTKPDFVWLGIQRGQNRLSIERL